GVRYAVNGCGFKSSHCTFTIGDGVATVVRRRSTTWSCCTTTVTGRSTHAREVDGIKPRSARNVAKGLSRRMGNYHIRFLGGPGAAMPSGYPTLKDKSAIVPP